jgi:hypothetical protein
VSLPLSIAVAVERQLGQVAIVDLLPRRIADLLDLIVAIALDDAVESLGRGGLVQPRRGG